MMKVENEMIASARTIYNVLQDEESRNIFDNRILWSLTGDERYTANLILPAMQEVVFEALDKIPLEQGIIICGTNSYSDIIFNLCKHRKIICFCDDDLNRQKSEYKDLPVFSKEEVVSRYNDAAVFITEWEEMDTKEKFFEDFLSEKKVITFSDLLAVLEKKQYFPEEIISLEEEIFVDGGCYDLATSQILIQKCTPKKIYAFEPDHANYLKAAKAIETCDFQNIDLFQAGLWNEKSTLCFDAKGYGGSKIVEDGEESIKVVALDDVIQGEVTFIKMDIEGAELEALEGAKNLIQKYKPKLAISIYHKPEDIINIPIYILSLVPEYKFYIRQHSFVAIKGVGAGDTVLYAVL